MLETILLSGVASYGPNGQTLKQLKEVNYFYGSNGSGKTTISRLIAAPAHPDHQQCRLSWKGSRPLESFVYNRDFVEENFGTDEIKGVFTVGKQGVDAAQKIALLGTQVAELTDKVADRRRMLQGSDAHVLGGKLGDVAELSKRLQAACWQQKTKHAGELSEALEGYRNDKAKFLKKVLETHATPPPEGYVPASFEELCAKAATIYGPSKTKEAPIHIPSGTSLIALESTPVLAKVVVGKKDVDVAALIENLGNSDWVKQGQTYLRESEGACPFCQQRTPETLEESLSQYFDKTFLKDIADIDAVTADYEREARAWLAAATAPLESKHPRVDQDKLRTALEAANAQVEANLLLLAAKRREPSRPISLGSLSAVVDSVLVSLNQANLAIEKHNSTVTNLAAEKARLTDQVWRRIVDVELKATLDEHFRAEQGLQRAVQSLNQQIRELESQIEATRLEIQALERQTTSVQPTVDEINRLLKSYGFTSFSIERDGDRDRYHLRRGDGSSARKTLSEGERTFITFLYFYFLVQGSMSNAGTQSARIVVLDDPVSSLDSDVLFIVSSLIHRLIASVKAGDTPLKQIFLLTHNVHFHKEVSFDPKRGKKSLRHETFWVVRKVAGQSSVDFHEGNPVSSSYDMLWAELRRPGPPSPSIQNTLRRILETYFKILGGFDLNRVWEKFEPADQPTCKSLFSWVNAGSHGALDDLHLALDESSIERHLRVFREVFRVSNHLAHYKMMMHESGEDTPACSEEFEDSTADASAAG